MNNAFTSNILADALENYVREKSAARNSLQDNGSTEFSAGKYSNYLSQLDKLWVHSA